MDHPRLVLITGAGSGIGRATAEAFAAGGATVLCADIDSATADETVRLVTSRGGKAAAYQLDVADSAAWERLADTVHTEHGVPDVLVNNAGIGMGGSFLSHTAEDWRRIIDINLMGVVHGCRVFGTRLAGRHREQPETRGHIVNVASAAAFTPSRILPAYVTTKAAVLMLSEALRAEMAEHKVGVSAICPGFIATNIYTASTFTGLDADEQHRRGQAAGSFASRLAPGPDVVARRMVSAVRRNRSVVPVTTGAWVAYGTYHFLPPLMRLAARFGREGTLTRIQRLAENLFRLLEKPAERRKQYGS